MKVTKIHWYSSLGLRLKTWSYNIFFFTASIAAAEKRPLSYQAPFCPQGSSVWCLDFAIVNALPVLPRSWDDHAGDLLPHSLSPFLSTRQAPTSLPPFPFPHVLFCFPFPHIPSPCPPSPFLPLEVGPPKSSYEVWGSTVRELSLRGLGFDIWWQQC